MTTMRFAWREAALIACVALAGCDRAPADAARTTTARPEASASAATADSSPDPSVPTGAGAARASGTDAGNSALTREERTRAMPLPGQANDHSNPEFAKKGDDRSTAGATPK